MRTSIILLYILVGVLAMAGALLYERERAATSTSQATQALPVEGSSPKALVQDRESLSTTPEVDRRFPEISKRLEELAAEVEQLKTSTGRSSIAAPPPSEAEFMNEHRASVLQIMDEEQRKRDWNKTVESVQASAGSLADRCSKPEAVRSLLREFGAEYMKKAGSILDEARENWAAVNRDGSPEQRRWTQAWRDLEGWAQGRLGEIDAAHAEEMWNQFRNLVSGLSYHFMPR